MELAKSAYRKIRRAEKADIAEYPHVASQFCDVSAVSRVKVEQGSMQRIILPRRFRKPIEPLTSSSASPAQHSSEPIRRLHLFTAKPLLIAALLLAPSTSVNAEADLATREASPERISFLVTFGDDKCPEGVGDEIVVCAPAPESDRYRIPRDLRDTEKNEVSGGNSWTSAVESLDGYARAVLPDSCSVNGSNGFTGCARAALEQWHAERRSKRDAHTAR